ncbi:hypothetical protein L7F22_010255 [Adiantum nelumboides]|nr:hypothetical protein [Adiantum nelumboides]
MEPNGVATKSVGDGKAMSFSEAVRLEVTKHLNGLVDPFASKRLEALKQLKAILLGPTQKPGGNKEAEGSHGYPLAVQHLLEEALAKPLLRRFADSSEKCRLHSISLLSDLHIVKEATTQLLPLAQGSDPAGETGFDAVTTGPLCCKLRGFERKFFDEDDDSACRKRPCTDGCLLLDGRGDTFEKKLHLGGVVACWHEDVLATIFGCGLILLSDESLSLAKKLERGEGLWFALGALLPCDLSQDDSSGRGCVLWG